MVCLVLQVHQPKRGVHNALLSQRQPPLGKSSEAHAQSAAHAPAQAPAQGVLASVLCSVLARAQGPALELLKVLHTQWTDATGECLQIVQHAQSTRGTVSKLVFGANAGLLGLLANRCVAGSAMSMGQPCRCRCVK